MNPNSNLKLKSWKWALVAILCLTGFGASAFGQSVPSAHFIWQVRLENVLDATDTETYLVDGLMIPDLTGEIYREMPPPPLVARASRYAQIYWETQSTFTLKFSVPDPTLPAPRAYTVRGDFAYDGADSGENLWIGWDRFPFQQSCFRFGPGYPGNVGAGAVGTWVDEEVVKVLFKLPNFTPGRQDGRIPLAALSLDNRLTGRFIFKKNIGTMFKTVGGPKYRVIIEEFGIDQVTTPY